jgi:hypothetical protein
MANRRMKGYSEVSPIKEMKTALMSRLTLMWIPFPLAIKKPPNQGLGHGGGKVLRGHQKPCQQIGVPKIQHQQGENGGQHR